MISFGFLSGQTPFTLLLWLLSAFCFFGGAFLFGRYLGFIYRAVGTSSLAQRNSVDCDDKRFFELFTGGAACMVVHWAIEAQMGISAWEKTPDVIFFGLLLIGFVAGYAHDHWEHRRKELKRESQPGVTLEKRRLAMYHQSLMNNETSLCDCRSCERRRRRAARKRR